MIFSIMFLVLVPYAVARFFLRSHARDETETLSSSIIFRTASLHGLILALIFAQEMADVLDLRQTSAHEAAAVADLFYDLDRYHPTLNASLRRATAEYVRVVIEEEWDTLRDGHLSQRAWDLWDEVYSGVLDLNPETPRQQAVRERMLVDIDTISESRNMRSAESDSGVTGLFWLVAILGVVFVVLPYFVFPARKINLLLLGSFAAYNGVVIYTIFAMSTPFSPPGAVKPVPFLEIFQHDMEQMLGEDDAPAASQVRGRQGNPDGEPLPTSSSENTAIIPVQKLEQDFYDWRQRHERVMDHIREKQVDLVFIGDSITHMFGGSPRSQITRGGKTWDKYYGHRNALNLGFGWDRTQNVLWRLTNGELEGMDPRVAVVLIGTNNRTGTANARENTPAEITDAIEAICMTIHARLPACRILLLGVLPRGPVQFVEPIREINRLLAPLGEKEYISFLDMQEQFSDEKGLPRKELMHDDVHPNAAGYRVWAETMEPVLSRLLEDHAIMPDRNARAAP